MNFKKENRWEKQDRLIPSSFSESTLFIIISKAFGYYVARWKCNKYLYYACMLGSGVWSRIQFDSWQCIHQYLMCYVIVCYNKPLKVQNMYKSNLLHMQKIIDWPVCFNNINKTKNCHIWPFLHKQCKPGGSKIRLVRPCNVIELSIITVQYFHFIIG